jgi:hypothetical protein
MRQIYKVVNRFYVLYNMYIYCVSPGRYAPILYKDVKRLCGVAHICLSRGFNMSYSDIIEVDYK